jgi:hypothetical protein
MVTIGLLNDSEEYFNSSFGYRLSMMRLTKLYLVTIKELGRVIEGLYNLLIDI